MSRTRKGNKGPGYDYWSRRMGNGSMCNAPGPVTKLDTHRKERQRDQRVARQEKDAYERDRDG